MASIENRGNGSWRIVLCAGYTPDGSKRRVQRTIKVDPTRTLNAQRKEAEKKAAELETDFRRNLITDAHRITLEKLAEDFLDAHGRHIAPATLNHYKHLLNGRIVPALGKKAVQELTAHDIQRFYRNLEDAPALTRRSKTGKLSGNTILHYHRCLHALLNYAKRMSYLTVNPCDSVEIPKNDTRPTDFYEPQDCAKLLDALDTLPDLQWRTFFYLSIYTGCRPGELLGLDWSDISGNLLTIHAGSVYQPGTGTVRTDRPKTAKSVRTIDLPPAVMALLKAHRAQQTEYKLRFGSNWPEPSAIFTGALGHRLDTSSPTQKFQKILKAYGLRPIPLYGLRHSAASIMIRQGLNPTEVAARLGHAQVSMTLNTYSHAFADAGTRATNAIVSALENARKQAK